MNLLIEAVVVGLVVVLLGNGIYRLPSKNVKNLHYLLFLTGFAAHFIFEWIGANKWYCIHGTACRNDP